MHRQSITENTLSTLIKRSDFFGVPSGQRTAHAKSIVKDALASSNDAISVYPLKKWILRGKVCFSPDSVSAKLLFRKLASNAGYALPKFRYGRNSIVENLRHLLGEGVPYRLYRLDINSFYESLKLQDARDLVENCDVYAPSTKIILSNLLNYQILFGEAGLPRGLAISSTLSELMMLPFDYSVESDKNVFFYARYVDDIIILTGAKEDPKKFVHSLTSDYGLPKGLTFNEKKYFIKKLPKSVKDPSGTRKLQVEYLGYEFSVADSIDLKPGSFRTVKCSISDKKINKIKTRIVRALLDYRKNSIDDLLVDRFRFLTSNFKIFNNNSGRSNMAGIYFNYPLIDNDDVKLHDLDKFLRGAVICASRRTGRGLQTVINNSLKKKLLTMSFVKGHQNQIFTHFSGNRLKLIGKCWEF